MKNYKQMTYRYLKGQRNRTLLTIFGIILSVALISAIGTIIVSTRGALIEEAIRENGSYHGKFEKVDKETLDKIKNHTAVEEYGVSKFIGSAAVVETTQEEVNDYGIDIPYRYIEINSYDKDTKSMLPINIKEGRIPKSPDEIAIEKWMVSYFDKEIKLGDKIKLTIGNRVLEEGEEKNLEDPNDDNMEVPKEAFEKTGEKEFTVVGFINPGYIWKGSLITQGIAGFEENISEKQEYNIYIKISNLKNAREKISNIAKDVGVNEENIKTNERLLRLSAESVSDTFNESILGILIFIVSLIMISTIAVIYNAFNISVLERISQFGLLRSIGATPKQIKSIVLKEAAILSGISIPIGLFSGVFAMKIVIYVISMLKSDLGILRDMKIVISPTVFIISTIVGLITVFLSAIGPAKQAGRVSPLEAVRNTGEIKKESFKKIKSSKLARKFLGIEGEIAYKNLRRNRKRFIITVFSMVISIALFITFSTFSDFMFKIGAIDSADMGDFNIYGEMGDRSEEVYTKLMELEDVDRVYKVVGTNGEVLLEEEQISHKIIEMSPYMFEDKIDNLTRVSNIEITTIGDDNFQVLKGLLKSGTIDTDKLNKENGVLVINNTYAYKGNSNARVLLEGYNLKVGDKIPFASYDQDIEGEDTKYTELTVVGVLEKGILGNEYSQNGSINMITTEDVWNKLYEGEEDLSQNRRDSYTRMYIEMSENGNRENVSELLNELEDTIPGLSYIDAVERAKEARDASIVMSIFLYGFVTIIALISAINIINTISTNIILRTKEIAMIKAVGMTQGGIKRMISFESLFYGLYATIFGGTLGAGLTYILFRLVAGISEFEYKLPWQNVIIACVSASVITLLAGVYPLKRINEKIIIESIKAEN